MVLTDEKETLYRASEGFVIFFSPLIFVVIYFTFILFFNYFFPFDLPHYMYVSMVDD